MRWEIGDAGCEMDFFDHETEGMVRAREIVKLFTVSRGVREEDLVLPPLAIVTFSRRILDGLVGVTGGNKSESWHGRNPSLFLATVGDRSFALTRSPYGAPGAVILLEELIAFGVNRILFVGYCGSIQNRLGLGEVVLPTHVLREEGTSHHYLPRGMECRPDRMLFDTLYKALRQGGVVAKTGAVWTTDALYRETGKKIKRYRTKGVLAVDMEISALFAVGAFRMVSVVGLLLVSDRLSRERWTPGFFDPLLLKKERVINGIIVEWIGDLV